MEIKIKIIKNQLPPRYTNWYAVHKDIENLTPSIDRNEVDFGVEMGRIVKDSRVSTGGYPYEHPLSGLQYRCNDKFQYQEGTKYICDINFIRTKAIEELETMLESHYAHDMEWHRREYHPQT